MSYIKNSLAENEEIIEYFYLNKYMYFPIYLVLFFRFAMIGYGLYLLSLPPEEKFLEIIPNLYAGSALSIIGLLLSLKSVYNLFYFKSMDMGLTNRRIVLKTGIIAINTKELRLQAIETVEVKQGALDRILGFGDVYITGRGNSIIIYKGVEDPVYIKKKIASMLNNKDQAEN